ncbi:MAG: hypothetical protein BWY63_03840 [Chloroflexi bacterium ADurb.Bin360]|nr:MAG: hypothetical protein BWY63_03840 [Chloroflexi bacterium ADurb.Bin360]
MIRRAVAYRVTSVGDQPDIVYAGVVSPDIVLDPQLAVRALCNHGFPEVYVEITQRSAAELRALWGQPIQPDEDEEL